jgi:hypothetical protein
MVLWTSRWYAWRKRRRKATKESGGNQGIVCEDVVGNREGREEELVEGIPSVTAVVVDKAEDLKGRGVEEEVGYNCRIAMSIERHSL